MVLALGRLMRPRSVAIVGASDKPGSLGASVLANLERQGFAGTIHLVNPKRAQIGGRPCLPTVDYLPDGVDAAVLVVPRAAVLETVQALARIAAWRDRDLSCAAAAPLAAGDLPAGVVPNYRAKAILAPLGLPFPQARLAFILAEAQAAAEAVGWPVVLKAQSADLGHKSDAGGGSSGWPMRRRWRTAGRGCAPISRITGRA